MSCMGWLVSDVFFIEFYELIFFFFSIHFTRCFKDSEAVLSSSCPWSGGVNEPGKSKGLRISLLKALLSSKSRRSNIVLFFVVVVDVIACVFYFTLHSDLFYISFKCEDLDNVFLFMSLEKNK